MLQAILGTSFRIAYTAKNFTTGLTDVQLFLTAPNNTTIGPLGLTEMKTPAFASQFAGTYYVDIVMTQQGVYLGSIDSISLPQKAEVSIANYIASPFCLF